MYVEVTKKKPTKKINKKGFIQLSFLISRELSGHT